MRRVLVTGARGYLASLAQLYNAGRYEFVRVSHTDVDFRDPAGVERFFGEAEFDICLHMAADATTAHCEQDPEGTHRVNTESAIAVARACRERGRRVVFISTEQCFNASPGSAPFSEEDEQASTTRYGQQKMEADAWIRENVDDYLILRFSWMFGLALPGVRPSPNILTNVLGALRSGTPAAFRVHERRNMTYAQRFAGQLPEILALPSGAYHFASQNGRTTYETARLVAERLGCPKGEVDRLILPDEKTYAERPRDFRLASDKIRAAGIELGTFEEDLELCLRDFGLAS
ncbi:SDR family oxidoreductase [Thermophilibacter mediterraneus]|uniref:SDR family oxidoreductase n=1 Tax=Thermophilibacter mediterraneus TaxID=1871031 RepID=UPI0009306E93|nr:sugar nucleotide-binding protein [Thermophilibacter mediterraneus]